MHKRDCETGGTRMIEYTENDIKEIWEALSTLILKCAEKNSHELNCAISYGDKLKLDCYFDFKVHKED
jgi:hypothetical protein